MHNRDTFPAALMPILVRIPRIQFFHIQILLIDARAVETEGDLSVVSNQNPGSGGPPPANPIPPRREKRNVPRSGGTTRSRCGSEASSGLPETDRVPSTTQLLLP